MGKGVFTGAEKKNETGDRNGDLSTADEHKELVTESGSSEEGYVKPPDGGWGWMVVFSSFLIHVIADGVVYSFGVFLTELTDYFDAGRGAVSWVGSLQPAVTFTVGPLSSALTNRYGCRAVTIAGALIAGLGFILSVFAPNLYVLYLTGGVMAGVGFGLIYLPAIVCVAQYFEKRRAFATGLAVCGSGFGTFLLAPFTEFLVMEYKWQGAMLILGGVILNIVVCGIIFRPLEGSSSGGKGSDTSSSVTDTDEEQLLDNTNSVVTTSAVKVKGGKGSATELEVLVEKRPELTKQEKENISDQGLQVNSSFQRQHSLPNGTPAHMEHRMNSISEDVDIIVDASLTDTSLTDTVSSLPVERHRLSSLNDSSTNDKNALLITDSSVHRIAASQSLAPTLDDSNRDIANFVKSEGALNTLSTVRQRNHHHPHHEHHSHGTPNTLAPITRKDIFYSGSLLNIPMYRSHPDMYKSTVSTNVHHHTDHDRVDSHEPSTDGGKFLCFSVSEEFRQTMRDMLSTELLKNPVFLMFGISNFFTSIGFNMPFIFLPDRAILAGIDKDRATMLVAVIGIANTFGRIVFGALSDRKWVNRLMLYSTALTICGVATALSAAAGGNYPLLVLYAAVFGIFIGVYVSLTSVVLVDLLGLEYLTNSFGLLLLFQGAATFIGPPIAGWLCDWTGSYDISFIVMGSLIALSGAMLYFLPLVERRYNKRRPREAIVHDMELGKHSISENPQGHVS